MLCLLRYQSLFKRPRLFTVQSSISRFKKMKRFHAWIDRLSLLTHFPKTTVIFRGGRWSQSFQKSATFCDANKSSSFHFPKFGWHFSRKFKWTWHFYCFLQKRCKSHPYPKTEKDSRSTITILTRRSISFILYPHTFCIHSFSIDYAWEPILFASSFCFIKK